MPPILMVPVQEAPHRLSGCVLLYEAVRLALVALGVDGCEPLGACQALVAKAVRIHV